MQFSAEHPYLTRSQVLALASPGIELVVMVETEKGQVLGTVVTPVVIQVSNLATLLCRVAVEPVANATAPPALR